MFAWRMSMLVVLFLLSTVHIVRAATVEVDLHEIYPDMGTYDSNGYYLVGFDSGDAGKLAFGVGAPGDINNDSLNDLSISYSGATWSSTFGTSLLFGSSESYPSMTSPELKETASMNLRYDESSSNLRDAAAAGDVNNDGIGDMLIYNSAGVDKAFLLFGRNSSSWTEDIISLNTMDLSLGVMLKEVEAISYVGDFNGDGIDDILCSDGGYSHSSPSRAQNGAVYVVPGKEGDWGDIILDDTNSFMIVGAYAKDKLGTTIQGAGDVNNDGYADIIVRTDSSDSSYDESGQVYVIFGRNVTVGLFDLLDFVTNDTNGFMIQGGYRDLELGTSIHGGFDLNQDGYDEVIVGIQNSGLQGQGAALILLGKENGFEDVDFYNFESSNTTGFILTGDSDFKGAGSYVQLLGDLDGDSYPEIFISQELDNSAYIVYGHSGEYVDSSLADLEDNGYAKAYKLIDVDKCLFIGDTKGEGTLTLMFHTLGTTFPVVNGGEAFIIHDMDTAAAHFITEEVVTTDSPSYSPSAYPSVSPSTTPSHSPSTSPSESSASPTQSPTDEPTSLSTSSDCTFEVTLEESAEYMIFVSSEVADEGGIALTYGDESACDAITINSLDLESSGGTNLVSDSGGSESRLYAMILFAAFLPMFLVSSVNLTRSKSVANFIPHFLLSLLATFGMVYCILFGYVSGKYYKGVQSFLEIGMLDLGFLLQAYIVTHSSQFPFFGSNVTDYESTLSMAMIIALVFVISSSNAAFAVALVTDPGSAPGYASLIVGVLGSFPASIFAGFAYLRACTRISLYTSLGILLFQQTSIIAWIVLAFEGESSSGIVTAFLGTQMLFGSMFVLPLQTMYMDSSQKDTLTTIDAE